MFVENDSMAIKRKTEIRRNKMIKLSKQNRHKGRTEFGRNLYNPRRKNGNSTSFICDCPCHPCPTNKIVLRRLKLKWYVESELMEWSIWRATKGRACDTCDKVTIHPYIYREQQQDNQLACKRYLCEPAWVLSTYNYTPIPIPYL